MATEPKPVVQRSLRELFCEAYACTQEEFAERAFWMSLRPHTRFVIEILWRLKKRFFEPDLEMLRHLGNATNSRELCGEVEMHRDTHPPTGLLRKHLKIRVSGQHLINLATRLFAHEESRKLRAAKSAAAFQPPPATTKL